MIECKILNFMDFVGVCSANAWEEGDEVVLISCRAQKTNTKIWKEKFPQENDIDLEKPQL